MVGGCCPSSADDRESKASCESSHTGSSSCASTSWRRRCYSRGTVDPPTQAVATPQADQVTPPDGLTAANAVEISDSEDELLITPERRRLREQLQSWRSSSSD